MPIRKLAEERGCSAGTISSRIQKEMGGLPRNEWLSQIYCNQWGGILLVDGVYLKVKGYERAIPFIYGVDFLTHDIPFGILAPSENEEAFLKFFGLLRGIHYPLRLVVADEAPALKPALMRVFPSVGTQLCHVHVLRGIRGLLGKRDEVFLSSVKHLLRTEDEKERSDLFIALLLCFHENELYREILLRLSSMGEYLFRYVSVRKEKGVCPKTTNLIEGMNSHLKGRLKSVKGFESFTAAERWMNAYVMRRRFKAFTDCDEPFKHLNGHTSFETSKRYSAPWPDIQGISPPKYPKKGARI